MTPRQRASRCATDAGFGQPQTTEGCRSSVFKRKQPTRLGSRHAWHWLRRLLGDLFTRSLMLTRRASTTAIAVEIRGSDARYNSNHARFVAVGP